MQKDSDVWTCDKGLVLRMDARLYFSFRCLYHSNHHKVHTTHNNETVAMIDYTNLYIKNLDADVTSYDLFKHFRGFGKIISARVMKETATGISKGYGFVSFTTMEEASEALEQMNGVLLNTKHMIVTYHTHKKPLHHHQSSHHKQQQQQQHHRASPPPPPPPSTYPQHHLHPMNTSPPTHGHPMVSNHSSHSNSSKNSQHSPPYSAKNHYPQHPPHRHHPHYPASSYSYPAYPHYQPHYYGSSKNDDNPWNESNGLWMHYTKPTPSYPPPTTTPAIRVLPSHPKGMTVADDDNPTATMGATLPLLPLGSPSQPPSLSPPPPTSSSKQQQQQQQQQPYYYPTTAPDNLLLLHDNSIQIQKLREAISLQLKACQKKDLDDLVDLIQSLKKRELSLCLFNPSFLRQKIEEAYEALYLFQTNTDATVGDAAVGVSSTNDHHHHHHNNNNNNNSSHHQRTMLTAQHQQQQQQPPQQNAAQTPTTTPTTTTTTTTTHTSSSSPHLVSTHTHYYDLQSVHAILASLEGMTSNKKKRIFGDLFFPYVKATGVKHAPKVTIRLLDTVPLQQLAYCMFEKPELTRMAYQVHEELYAKEGHPQGPSSQTKKDPPPQGSGTEAVTVAARPSTLSHERSGSTDSQQQQQHTSENEKNGDR
ncbi:hypothetical protein BDF20DRAFT_944591 [Mycotypha africana]|uniref:uncharacterized protein n=1 Tax=Mycotypha africana TaxID=64632 RepID=UPI0023019FDD|nr:uncharacterized protein BDF20DRAFT_944591 [Mycotypha africana]KAI8975544.1 hypothetical protein BDF20DRAFT_944591 [Mycotypha africana]